jgi:pantetheine-phosphate adenylyltransferase
MIKRAIYPGSFDPITYGHIDIVKRALNIFDEVIVAVAENPQKNLLFCLQERLSMVKRSMKNLSRVKVESFSGLVVDYAKEKKINVIIRGIRMVSDFEYEFQMALTNRRLSKDLETIFLMPSESYSFISSKLLKEAASLGADLSSFVPPFVDKALKDKLRK